MNFFLDSSLKLSVSCDVHKEAGICVENVRKKNLKNKKKIKKKQNKKNVCEGGKKYEKEQY